MQMTTLLNRPNGRLDELALIQSETDLDAVGDVAVAVDEPKTAKSTSTMGARENDHAGREAATSKRW